MSTNVVVDDDLLAEAREFVGLQDNAELVREALTSLIAREAARRLARMGGIAPDAEAPPRRRF